MKRILYIFLSLSLIVPQGINASQGKQERKTEEKKSSSWWAAAAGTTLAAIVAYLGYQAMQGDEVSDQPSSGSISKKRTPQEYITLVHQLENIYLHDPKIREKRESDKNWFGTFYQKSIAEALAKKYPEIVKDYIKEAKKFNPLDTRYFEENPKLKNDRAFFEFYYPFLVDYYTMIIADIGTSDSYREMRKLLPGLPATPRKSPAFLQEEEMAKQAEAMRKKQEASAKQRDMAELAVLKRNICVVNNLSKIYYADANIAVQRKESNIKTINKFYRQIKEQYPEIYEGYMQSPNREYDEIDLDYFQGVKDIEFQKQYFSGMASILETIIKGIGTKGRYSSQEDMKDVLEKTCR